MSEPVHTTSTPGISTSAPTITVPGVSTYVGPVAGTPEAPDPTPEQPAETPPAEPKPTETVDYWKQRARQNEAQAKANADAAKRLKEIEDRDLSELQRAQRDREDALTRLASIEQEAVRNRVALDKGLPADIAATLNGANEEELAAHADRLIAWRGNVPPATPRPDPGQGPRPTTPEMEAESDYLRFFPDEAPKAR